MARKLTPLETFTARLEAMGLETVETATAGLWEVHIVKTARPLYIIGVNNPRDGKKMEFRGDDPKTLAWKLVGIQANISKLEWDELIDGHPEVGEVTVA